MEDNEVRYTARDKQKDDTPPTDEFARRLWELIRLPGAVKSTERTLTLAFDKRIGTETFIVQTYRHSDIGDLIFLQRVSSEGPPIRLVIPPEISDIIARQRDSVAKKVRSKIAKRTMQDRKDRGEVFGFQKKKQQDTA